MALNRGVENYFNYNHHWLKSKNLHSHTLTFWFNRRWVVQIFVLDTHLASAKQWSKQRMIERHLQELAAEHYLSMVGLDMKAEFDRRLKPPREPSRLNPYLVVSPTRYLRRRRRRRLVYHGNFITHPSKDDFKFLPARDRHRGVLYRNHLLPRRARHPRRRRIILPRSVVKINAHHRMTYFASEKFDLLTPRSGLVRLDTTRYLLPLNTSGVVSFAPNFSTFVNQIQPRGARLGLLSDLSRLLQTQFSRVVRRPVEFSWRIIKYPHQGLITMWLNFIRYRVNQRATYKVRTIVYPLLRYAAREGLSHAGWSIRCHGRFTRQQRAERGTYRFGAGVKAFNHHHLVDQVLYTFPLKFGAIGIKLTVRY